MVLLKNAIFSPVTPVRDRVRQVLRAVDLDRHSRVRAQKVHFKAPDAVEWNWQLGVYLEAAFDLR